MIPGASMTKDKWNPKFIENLSKNNTLILINNKDDSIKEMADNIKLNETVDVIGHSMGGMVAQELAITSDKIDKLILLSTHCAKSEPSKEAQQYLNMSSGIERIESGVKVKFPEKWVKDNPAKVKKYIEFEKALKFNETLGLRHYKAINSWDGVCDKIKNIDVPTLVIVGDKDEITWKKNSQHIAEEIPESKLIVIKGGGHAMLHQFPDNISSKILDFLK